jgi:choline kinase
MKKSIYDKSLWSIKKPTVSILVPSRDMVHSHFAYSLSQLVKTCVENGLSIFTFFDSSTILLNQRENLIELAKESNSDYVLWLDSDMVFPSTTILRLLEHDKDIVGCNYMKRTKPIKTVAYTDVNDWDSWVKMERKSELVNVDAVGLGCILMKINVFEKLNKPYFEFRFQNDTNDWYGEDYILMEKLKDNGYDIYIDTVLSMDVKHMGLYAY